MKLSFIIVAHKRPDLLARLIPALGRPCALHIDAKSNQLDSFQENLSGAEDLHLLKSRRIRWGDLGLVEIALDGLRWFLTTSADYACILSGQCYPLWPVDAIEHRLAGLNSKSILHHVSFPYPYWHGGGFDRVDRYHVRVLGRPRALRLWPRKMPLSLHPYGGSAFWCLSRQAAQYVCAFVEEHPSLLRFFRYTMSPDEMFFQTVLANSPLRSTLISEETHFLTWELHGAHPGTIDNPTDALRSGKWFARKFEQQRVLDEVDAFRVRAAAEGWLPDVGEHGIATRASTRI